MRPKSLPRTRGGFSCASCVQRRRVILIDAERRGQPPLFQVSWDGIEVIGRRQAPAGRAVAEKAVIAQMVIGVRDQDREHHATPELAPILPRRRAMLPNGVRYLRIAPAFTILRAKEAHRREVWHTMCGSTHRHPVEADQ